MAKVSKTKKKPTTSRKKSSHLSFKTKLQLKLGEFFYPVLGLTLTLIMVGAGFYIYQQNQFGAGSNSYRYKKPSNSDARKMKAIASDYWQGICGKNGQDMKFIYYSKEEFTKRFSHLRPPTDQEINRAREYGDDPKNLKNKYDDARAYVGRVGAGLGKENNSEYCKVYINSDVMKSNHNSLYAPYGWKSNAMFCETMVHEAGHLANKYHDDNPRSVMKTPRNLGTPRSPTTITPRCYAEFQGRLPY